MATRRKRPRVSQETAIAQGRIGIIGGTGLYTMEGLSEAKEVRVSTPFGAPSSPFVLGTIEDVRVAFLSRHGIGHRFLPSMINFRANIYGMKRLGVQQVISVSAVGSMKEAIRPGDVVIPHQFYDHTRQRTSTFFGEGVVAHVAFADPVCPVLSEVLTQAATDVSATVHEGGVYLCIEGPQFSTRWESALYRQWGVDVIGMTNVTEAKLAREAEICYATLAFVTDYDCWHQGEKEVTAEAVVAILSQNTELAKRIIKKAVVKTPLARTCPCAHALRDALITPADQIPRRVTQKLWPLLGRYIKRGSRAV